MVNEERIDITHRFHDLACWLWLKLNSNREQTVLILVVRVRLSVVTVV